MICSGWKILSAIILATFIHPWPVTGLNQLYKVENKMLKKKLKTMPTKLEVFCINTITFLAWNTANLAILCQIFNSYWSMLKGVISNISKCKDDNAWFTTVPLNLNLINNVEDCRFLGFIVIVQIRFLGFILIVQIRCLGLILIVQIRFLGLILIV